MDFLCTDIGLQVLLAVQLLVLSSFVFLPVLATMAVGHIAFDLGFVLFVGFQTYKDDHLLVDGMYRWNQWSIERLNYVLANVQTMLLYRFPNLIDDLYLSGFQQLLGFNLKYM